MARAQYSGMLVVDYLSLKGAARVEDSLLPIISE